MAYPRKESEQVAWWTNQVTYARRRMKPLFDASNILVRQFYGETAGQREEDREATESSDRHLARVKSGLVYGWIDQSISNMVDRSPIFRCVPETREAAERIDPEDPNSLTMAQGVEKVVNYRYRETNQLRVDERTVQDAFLMPYGVVKIGYTLDYEKRAQDLWLPEDGDLVFDEVDEENLFLFTGVETRVTPTQDHRAHIEGHTSALQGELLGTPEEALGTLVALIESHIEYHQMFLRRPDPSSNANVRFEAPFAVHWPADMFLTDALCLEGPQDARWVAFGWELPIEEVQADPNYRNTSDLTPSRWRDAPEKPDELDSDGFDMIRGWEIWAKNFPVGRGHFEDRLLVIVEGHDKFLRNEKEWPYSHLDDYPAETLVFQPGHRSWFHKSPLLMGGADTVQGLVNEILDSYLSIIRKQKNIWLVDPTSNITQEVIQNILEAPDGSVIEVPGLMDMGNNAVIPLPFHQVPPEKGELLGVLQGMFDRSMGTPQPMSMRQPESATEASIMEKRNTSRENRRSGLLSEFQTRKARKMWQLDTQYRPERLFLVDKSAMSFVAISEEMARGDYLFSMDVTSHSTALSVERSQWMDLLNLFAGLTPMMVELYGLPPNLPELARRLLVRGFDDRVVEDVLPMLNKASQQMQEQGAMGPEGGMPAEGVEAAMQEGRHADRGIGPLDPDSFNRDIPVQGRLEGASETAKA